MMSLRQISKDLGVNASTAPSDHSILPFPDDQWIYPRGELCAARKTAESLEQFTKSSVKRVGSPIWMLASFHGGWGRVETLSPTLLFVDTGLVGAGVKWRVGYQDAGI